MQSKNGILMKILKNHNFTSKNGIFQFYTDICRYLPAKFEVIWLDVEPTD